MKSIRWLSSIFAVGVGAVACSSSSGGGSSSTDASVDASACGDIAACYGVTVTVDPASPAATCGSGNYNGFSDYTAVTGDGPFTSPTNCTGKLANCVMTLTCPDGSKWSYTFTRGGFSATVVSGSCKATAVGTRLASCPTGDAGGAPGDGGGDATVGPDAALDGGADAPPDTASGDGAGDALAPVDSAVPDAVSEAGDEGGADSGAPEGAADDGGDAAAAPDGGDDGSSTG
jgi:hypothetical protein